MKEVNIAAVRDKIELLKRCSNSCVDRINTIRLEHTSTKTTTDTNGNEYEVTTWDDDTQRLNSYELNEIRIAYDAKSFELEKLLSTYREATEAINKLMTSNTEV